MLRLLFPGVLIALPLAAAAAAESTPLTLDLLGGLPCLEAPGCDGPAPAAAVEPFATPEAPAPSAVPAPAALALLGAAMTLLALMLRRGKATT